MSESLFKQRFLDVAAEVAQLRAELAACREDAERYRWLHQFDRWSWTMPPMRAISFTWLIHCTKEHLDAAIDAARKETKE